MKAVRITELDNEKHFPIGFILKGEGSQEITGCCPKAFFNFFRLLDVIEGLNSEFLLWLKSELKENDETLITPYEGLESFIQSPIFEKINCEAGFSHEIGIMDFLNHLHHGCVLFTILFSKGLGHPSHCVVFHIEDKKLFADGFEISLETFAKMIFCHEKNRFILGQKKGEVIPRP